MRKIESLWLGNYIKCTAILWGRSRVDHFCLLVIFFRTGRNISLRSPWKWTMSGGKHPQSNLRAKGLNIEVTTEAYIQMLQCLLRHFLLLQALTASWRTTARRCHAATARRASRWKTRTSATAPRASVDPRATRTSSSASTARASTASAATRTAHTRKSTLSYSIPLVNTLVLHNGEGCCRTSLTICLGSWGIGENSEKPRNQTEYTTATWTFQYGDNFWVSFSLLIKY